MLKTSLITDNFLQYRNLSRVLTALLVTVNGFTLLGWALDISFLKQPLPNSAVVNPTTAVCFLFCGTAVILLSYQRNHNVSSYIIRALIVAPVLIGLVRTFEWLVNIPFQVDTYLFNQSLALESNVEIVRMAGNSAINFVLCGVAIFMVDFNTTRSKSVANTLLVFVSLISIFSVIVYVYQVSEFYKAMRYFPMAVQSAICFLLLSFSLLLLNPEGGYMRIITSKNAGGMLARLLIPTIIIIPVVLGYARLFLSREYNITQEFGVSILVSLIIVVFLILIISMASQLNKQDRLRASAEEQINELNIELQKKVEEKSTQLTNVFEGIPDGFIALDANLNYIYANKRMEAMTGRSVQSFIGKNILELFPDAAETDTYKAFVSAMTNQQYLRNVEYYEPLDLWHENHIYPSADGLFVFITDITERKKAEKHQALLVSIVESSDEAIISKTLDGIITSWNKGAEDLFDYSREEVVGKSITILIPKDRYAEESLIIDKIKHGDYVNHYETIRLKKNGLPVYVSLTVSPIRDSSGKIIGASKLARDITERKNAEFEINNLNKEIRRSEQKLKALIENSDDIILLYDENYKTVYRSANYERITGWKIEESERMSPIDLIHEEDQSIVKKTMLDVLTYPGKSFNSKYRYKHREGHYLWMESVSKNLLHDPDIKGIITNFRDVTQHLQTQEKLLRSEKIYRSIASSIPGSVICIIDKDHRYVLVEGDMLEQFGLEKDKLVGSRISDVIPLEKFATLLPNLLRVFNGETFSLEHHLMHHDIVIRYVPLRDEANQVYAAMLVAIDITELKTAQHALHDLNISLEKKVLERTDQLASVNKELEAFSYSVSHDLRAPLRAINGYSQILEEDYKESLDDNGKRVLQIIKANGMRMSVLIDDLLAFSRLGRKEIQKFLLSMNELVQSVLQEVNRNNPNHNAEIIVHELPEVWADATLLKQVLLNFILNAIKYSSKQEKPRVEITSFIRNGAQVFSVQDNGAGFDMKYVHKLFGVFQRLHTADEFEGNGVGLATVKRIITKHGGEVWAEAEVGKGATFYFSVPVFSNQQVEKITFEYKA
jgi:PAS domain S-box-containing protein